MPAHVEIEISALGFDWDEGNESHCQKHGVSVEEIEGLFRCNFLMSDDIKHSQMEKRMIALGIPPVTKRPLFVVFTVSEKHGKNFIRPISARYMHKKEAQRYGKEITEL